MSPEETAGSIEMAFGVWGAVGPSNHVLDGGPDPPKSVGIACFSALESRASECL